MSQLYWYCSFCHTGNHPASVFCGSCGHPRPKPTFLSKITPGLVIAGALLFGSGMIFGGLVVGVTRGPASEARALKTSPQTNVPVPSSPSPPASPTNTPAARKPTPTPTPSATPFAEAVEPEISYTAPKPSASSRSSRYIRGPRGGCYYINSSGNKTYVDRSLCGSEEPSQPLYLTPPKSSSSGGYIRGPRGGCYYINSSGNKTYVDRSLCD